ncbi:crotonase/enoyl-CoA hydratase family protein [Chromobacterium vaccinii]|uniref:crotonase/enoyl-CoA hydratase family protein n=1 Tax=Chromobacterium vaccinii TaxID=1108595 RepID=UPI001E4B86A4|nr:crotonase/enoyl-CoA hydratase family protein [Chromobacterium vaccinii]MCD4483869.1 crotonase/enoyl-CoA hydratase family protein [Chromobacterium vaccinii]
MECYEYLDVKRNDKVLLVGLNRPTKRNAMSLTVMEELKHVFKNIEEDIGAVVLHSTSGHFCAGLDLSEVRGQSVIDCVHFFRKWHELFDLIQFGKVPVVAAINGAAIGGGLEIASACHIRVVDETTFFSLPEGVRGLYVGVGASVRLPRIAGTALMTDMMLTGRVIHAEESLSKGIAQYLTPEGKAIEKAIELATQIASNLPMTNYAIMHVLPKIVDQNIHDGLLTEAMIAAIVQSDPRTSERLADFLDRKKDKVAVSV